MREDSSRPTAGIVVHKVSNINIKRSVSICYHYLFI